MDPQVRRFQVFRGAFILVRGITGLTGSSLPTEEQETADHRIIYITFTQKYSVYLTTMCGEEGCKCLLFLMGVGVACTQDCTHYHGDDGERSHRNDDDDHQDMILLTACDSWLIWGGGVCE